MRFLRVRSGKRFWIFFPARNGCVARGRARGAGYSPSVDLAVDGGVGRVGGADADVVVSFAFVRPTDEFVEHAIDALAARGADGAAMTHDGFERERGVYGA